MRVRHSFSQSKIRFLPGSYSFLHCCDSLFPKLCDCPEVSGNEEGLIKRETQVRKNSLNFLWHCLWYELKASQRSLYAQFSWKAIAPWPELKRLICQWVTQSSHHIQLIFDFLTICQEACCTELFFSSAEKCLWGCMIWPILLTK